MNLDKGICTVYRTANTAAAGAKPVLSETAYYESWYGELSFETSPARPTDTRKEIRTDARIRILQNREIREHDRVALSVYSQDPEHYEIERAYHGRDDESGELITDLSLRKVVPA